MGSFSNYAENKILDHVFGATTFTPPTNLYVALFSVTPDDTGGGTELSGNGYSRRQLTNNTTNWPAASGGAKSNGVSVDFGPATTADWAQAVAWGIFDASSAGNLIIWGALNTPKTVQVGDTASFAVGDIDITLD